MVLDATRSLEIVCNDTLAAFRVIFHRQVYSKISNVSVFRWVIIVLVACHVRRMLATRYLRCVAGDGTDLLAPLGNQMLAFQ